MKELYERYAEILKLALVTPPETLNTDITEVAVYRPGLALSGFTEVYSHERVQVLGTTEMVFLESSGSDKRKEIFKNLVAYNSPLWIVTMGRKVFPEMLNECIEHNIPVMTTSMPTLNLCSVLQRVLEDWFLSTCTVHGTLVDVYGVGMLYTGKSGVGKSECALDLVERGHRLVADDVVTLTKNGISLIGRGSKALGHHMEIRGVGIVDVGMLFGIRAIRDKKKVEIVVELENWQRGEHYDRTGLDELSTDIMGVQVPKKVIPISPGKNITVISEVIAMNMLLKMNKVDVAKLFNEKLLNRIKQKSESKTNEISTSEIYE